METQTTRARRGRTPYMQATLATHAGYAGLTGKTVSTLAIELTVQPLNITLPILKIC